MARKTAVLVLVVAALLVSAPSTYADDTHIRIIQVTYVGGDVLVARSEERTPEPAQEFQPLENDSLVVTENGIGEIEFENEIVARLAEQSSLHLAELLQREDGSRFTRLTLRSGTATFLVKMRDDDEFLVSTPFFTVISDRKSRFRVDLTEEGGRVQVAKGRVEVQTPSETIQLARGRQMEWNASTSQLALAGLTEPDGWDEWNEERDDVVEAARRRERWTQYASYNSYDRYHYGHSHRWGYCPYDYAYFTMGHHHHYYASFSYYWPYSYFWYATWPYYGIYGGHCYSPYGSCFYGLLPSRWGPRWWSRRDHRRLRARRARRTIGRTVGRRASADARDTLGTRRRRGRSSTRRATGDVETRGRFGESWRERAGRGRDRDDFVRSRPVSERRDSATRSRRDGTDRWTPVSTGSSRTRSRPVQRPDVESSRGGAKRNAGSQSRGRVREDVYRRDPTATRSRSSSERSPSSVDRSRSRGSDDSARQGTSSRRERPSARSDTRRSRDSSHATARSNRARRSANRNQPSLERRSVGRRSSSRGGDGYSSGGGGSSRSYAGRSRSSSGGNRGSSAGRSSSRGGGGGGGSSRGSKSGSSSGRSKTKN